MIAREAATLRDGAHDFDFFVGTWRIHNCRLSKPLSGSNESYEFEGTCTSRPLWSGKANVDEAVFESPLGRIEGCTLRLYDAQTRKWSIYWGTAKNGLTPIPTVGSFDETGVGEFFDRETYEGKEIICRYRWSEITANSCRWEQAFSADEGLTWETNWTMQATRI